MKLLIEKLQQTEHGFKHIVAAGKEILKYKDRNHFEIAVALLEEQSYQGRMLATYLLGELSDDDGKALDLLLTTVANDPNWRVHEMLAKALDRNCELNGYEHSLDNIQRWLSHDHPNVRRAITEGLRIWTTRPYFKTHPEKAVRLIAGNKAHTSEYLRKSVGNALRDIARKHADLVQGEVCNWDTTDPKIAFTAKLAIRR